MIVTLRISSIASNDYTEVDEVLTFSDASQGPLSVQVFINDDNDVEADEIINVGIIIEAAFSNLAFAGTPNRAMITIEDDDGTYILAKCSVVGNIIIAVLIFIFCRYCI